MLLLSLPFPSLPSLQTMSSDRRGEDDGIKLGGDHKKAFGSFKAMFEKGAQESDSTAAFSPEGHYHAQKVRKATKAVAGKKKKRNLAIMFVFSVHPAAASRFGTVSKARLEQAR